MTQKRPKRLPDIMAVSLWLLPLLDSVIIGLAAVGSSIGLTYLRDMSSLWPWSGFYQIAVIFGVMLTPLVFSRLALYRSHRGESIAIELTQVAGAWLTVMAMLGVVAIATKTSAFFSRTWMLGWFLSGCVLLWFFRIGFRVVLANMRARGWDSRNIVLIGSGPEAANVMRRLRSLRGAGYRVAGYFIVPGEPVHPALRQIPCLGEVGQISEVLAWLDASPDQIWIALPAEKTVFIKLAVSQLARTTIDCRFVPDTGGFNIINHTVDQVAGLPVIDLSRSPMTGLNRVVKAAEDRVLAGLIILLVWPLMLLLAIAIKLDSPGPVFFSQKRHGWNGEEIVILKFRTMVLHKEEPGQVTQAKKDDARITRLGALMRRTSLDELPQFFNVLTGTMSVVGPRPHAVEHNRYYQKLVSGYTLRHKVKPGITGWAQVNGFRGETETLDMMRRRVVYDLYYIEHWSFWFDLAIVALTLVRGFISQRAY